MIASDVRERVATNPVVMRKSIDTLAAVVEKSLGDDPRSGTGVAAHTLGSSEGAVFDFGTCLPL